MENPVEHNFQTLNITKFDEMRLDHSSENDVSIQLCNNF